MTHDNSRLTNQDTIQINQPELPSLSQLGRQINTLKIIIGLLVIAVFTSVGVAVYLLNQYQPTDTINGSIQPPTTPIAVTPQTTTPASTETTVPGSWKTYTNSQYGLSIKYPPELVSTKSENDPNLMGVFQINKKGKNGEMLEGFGITMRVVTGEKQTIDQIIKSHHPSDTRITTKQEIVLDGTNVTKISGQGMYEFDEAIVLLPNGHLLITGLYGLNSSQYRPTFDQILSTFKLTNQTTPQTSNFTAPSTWTRTTIPSTDITVCLPPKWEFKNYDLIFNRDSGYQPVISNFTSLPYSGGSKREAYFSYWEKEYPDVTNLVTVEETNINGNPVLTINPKSNQTKESPEGLAVVWFAKNKLWKAGLSNWSSVNTSKTAFLKDFYTSISCSF